MALQMRRQARIDEIRAEKKKAEAEHRAAIKEQRRAELEMDFILRSREIRVDVQPWETRPYANWVRVLRKNGKSVTKVSYLLTYPCESDFESLDDGYMSDYDTRHLAFLEECEINKMLRQEYRKHRKLKREAKNEERA